MQVALNSSVLDQGIDALRHATKVRTPEITPETHLAVDLALGGFGRIKLAIYLEEAFNIELPDEALERFVTVADIIRYMGRH